MIPDFTLDVFLQMVENTKLTLDSDGATKVNEGIILRPGSTW